MPTRRRFLKTTGCALVVANSYLGPMKGAAAVPVSWAFTLPASGTRGQISSNVLNDVAAAADQAAVGETVAQMKFNMPMVLGAWGSGAVSLIKDASGRVVDVIYWIFGGGHGDCENYACVDRRVEGLDLVEDAFERARRQQSDD